MLGRITLAEAISTGRLDDFANQAEAEGVGPINRAEFEAILGRVIEPLQEDQTSRSPGSGGSRGT